MTYDRRTGKPIASLVSKIAPEVVMSEERVIGTVTTETHKDSETKNEVIGRISYENRGECFFLPFTQSDVEGNVILASGDKVCRLLLLNLLELFHSVSLIIMSSFQPYIIIIEGSNRRL